MPDQGSQRLKGRRIIVTGAASGIGKAIAELFHAEGAALALIDREADKLNTVAKQLGATPLVVDLAALETVEASVNAAAEAMKGLDGVVNCAGLGVNAPIEQVDLARFNTIVAINLTAPYLICRAAVPHMRKVKGSTIVNIASATAILPNSPNITAYAATKGGLVAFSKGLAAELAPHIRVNSLCPGVTNTPMAAPLLAGYANPSDAPWVKQYALQRVADPSEIARGVLFLTSAESSYVTGITLPVDGGRSFH